MKKILQLFFLIIPALLSNAQQVTTISNPELIPLKLLRVSPALRDLPESGADERTNGNRPQHDNPSLEHPMRIVNPDALPLGDDPALQTSYLSSDLTAVTILSKWNGLTANVDPSDNTIAVGPNHVLQMTNNASSTYIRVWNKSGTVLVNKQKVSAITGINDYGDPNVIYDEAADRFVLVVLYSFSAHKLVVCVSQTGDPTGSWYVYTFTTNGGFPDYPKLAVWDNSYFITTNSSSPSIFALKRSAMLNGQSMSAVQKFSLSSFPTIGFQSASPIMQTGATPPPAGSPETIIRVGDDAWGGSVGSDHLELFEVSIDWTNSANSTISGPTNLATLAYNSNLCGYNSWSCIPQPNTSSKLDPLSNIIMDKVQYRNLSTYETIVCSHVCNAGSGKAGIRWYELRKDSNGDWFIYQQSTYAPDANYRFMSSITVNQSGEIALGYNVSSSTVYPGLRVTGRDTCDALNTMAVTETTVKAGSSKNGSTRYGDYNGMVTDPSDGSFWFTANYNATTAWSTSVVHFSFNPCPIRIAAPDAAINDLRVVPNPATNEVTISFNSETDENVPLQLYDMTGQLVMQKFQHALSGYNEAKLDISSISAGYYIVKMHAKAGIRVEKLVVER